MAGPCPGFANVVCSRNSEAHMPTTNTAPLDDMPLDSSLVRTPTTNTVAMLTLSRSVATGASRTATGRLQAASEPGVADGEDAEPSGNG
mmetsp:Transcript_1193/g.3888  ORF Transcript_1193/g.3888 Transcript_1193/m.3888 type:complete len:89 (+) Transcript_1193:243-509(+)|eukprot:CAMPEP_0175283454 /NCGR_PEP_ID=MMETSP0093-20121207/52158_1 /TAXON_ID=311494 /ORGANISM="Alexandrium monilatum, Strain CCMP3105" /LENGTH=88 /DNA_ID=CAMNT_0016578693 /DNA_START=179 /DNA_END=445 /DNA_ORIENTATION=-